MFGQTERAERGPVLDPRTHRDNRYPPWCM